MCVEINAAYRNMCYAWCKFNIFRAQPGAGQKPSGCLAVQSRTVNFGAGYNTPLCLIGHPDGHPGKGAGFLVGKGRRPTPGPLPGAVFLIPQAADLCFLLRGQRQPEAAGGVPSGPGAGF